MGESHLAALTVMSIVLPAEGDVSVIHRQQPVIGDGHAVRVAGQILQDVFRSSERCLGVDDPVLPEESAEERRECFFVCQLAALPVEGELVPAKRPFQTGDDFPRKTRLSTLTGRKKWGGERIHRPWSGDSPPPGTTQ